MKKLLVLFFLICIAFGEWQQYDEIKLPKGIKVNDLTINNSGELWLLSTSSILKYEATSKNPFLIQEINDGHLLTVLDDKVYIVDHNNRLSVLSLDKGGLSRSTNLMFNAPGQIGIATADNKPFIIIQESGRLTFVRDEEILGSISTDVERFSTIPSADYDNKQTPLYTLANNRIYSWIDGTLNNTGAYKKRIIYSASNKILDFSADQNGNLYILFSDSMLVLEPNGDYKSKANIDRIPLSSRVLINPVNHNIIIFDEMQNILKILSGISKSRRGEIIILKTNQPNPVDNYTEIEFTINQPLNLSITVYNLIGKPVNVIAKGHYTKGTHRVTWKADDGKGNLVPNGVYFYRLESKKGVAIKQLTVLR